MLNTIEELIAYLLYSQTPEPKLRRDIMVGIVGDYVNM